ncbi:MAG: uracil-DNA glycosylase [Nocardioidaceae bacterium]
MTGADVPPPALPSGDRVALPHPLSGRPFESPVPPGTGWPDDPARPGALVAHDAADVERLAACGDVEDPLAELESQSSVCAACPRLVTWREDVAVVKRRAYADQPYWGRPIAAWGDPRPAVLIVGLAPAAHGGNRTGRIFTGDRSGDWLFAALHRVGLAARPTSVHAGDGQELLRTRMVAAVRCAPPDNRPTLEERDTCAPWLLAELRLVLPSLRVIVALGSYGFDAVLRSVRALEGSVPRPRPRFGHGVEVGLSTPTGGRVTLVGSFHPSQQNTFTGRLTEPMLDAALARAATLADP